MKGPPTQLGGWTPGRFWGVVGMLCVVQAGLLLLFAGRGRRFAPVASPSGQIQVLGAPLTSGQLTRTFFAVDPTVFPLPSRHGFSEDAWLRLPAPNFDVAPEMEAPACLGLLDAARLETDFPRLARTKSVLPFNLMDQGSSELEPWPIFPVPPEVRSQSLFEIKGEIADRQLNAPVELPAETNAQLLSNSVVQIAVDSAGQVVAARLLERSGSAAVDAKAVNRAWQLRFRPVSLQAPVWGEAVFEWQTAEPTNAVAGVAP